MCIEHLVTGIQQVGIGVKNADIAKLYYKKLFGFDTKVFDDEAEASLMTNYTGNKTYRRRAILAMNMTGGGGFEIWQFLNRQTAPAPDAFMPGDTGIFAIKIKAPDVTRAHNYISQLEVSFIGPILYTNGETDSFWVKDIFGNWFQVVQSNCWFKNNGSVCGGVAGAVIGVSDLEASEIFYKKMLCTEKVNYQEGLHTRHLPFFNVNHQASYKSLVLTKKCGHYGAFSKLLGSFEIELIQCNTIPGRHIFENRFWGDSGFIHLCLDISDMAKLQKELQTSDIHFTVDSSATFPMGQAGGRFCYCEDPDGTLIELVETHKVPIIKKIGWYLNLKKAKYNHPLPKWMISMLGISKV